jgi:hypothetical protein
MKYVLSVFFAFALLVVQAQSGRWYTTSGGEWIFSVSNVSLNGTETSGAVRFSPVFNFQNLVNYDADRHVGFFSGLNIRNVGFIYDIPDSDIRKKVRTYNVGIPLGIKLGNLDGLFVYAGYELELPINYKEKTFVNERKEDRFNVWFSDRTPVQHALMAGVQFPYSANVKFKYYLTEFFDRDYTETRNGVQLKPYERFDGNIFYVSLNFSLFRNTEFYYGRKSAE